MLQNIYQTSLFLALAMGVEAAIGLNASIPTAIDKFTRRISLWDLFIDDLDLPDHTTCSRTEWKYTATCTKNGSGVQCPIKMGA